MAHLPIIRALILFLAERAAFWQIHARYFCVWILLLILLTSSSAQVNPVRVRPRIAVSLSGGAAYSLAEFGALEWLEEHRIPVDALVGTSGGAIVGGWYATGGELLTDQEIDNPMPRNSDSDMKLHGLADLLQSVDLNEIFRPFPAYRGVDLDSKWLQKTYPFGPIAGVRHGHFTFTDGIVPGDSLERLLDRIAARAPQDSRIKDGSRGSFDALPIPFRAVAVEPHGYDLSRWNRIVLGSRDALPRLAGYRLTLQDAIRASIAIPYVFTPRYLPPNVNESNWHGYRLVDGGTRDNTPTDVAFDEFNPDVVIALTVDVDLSPLETFFHLTGHAAPPTGTIQAQSNAVKFGTRSTHSKLLEVPMRFDHARPDQFEKWRRLAFLGYKSMDRFARSAGGAALATLALSPDAFRRYRLERRARAEQWSGGTVSKTESAVATEATAAHGYGSVGIVQRDEGSELRPYPRGIGPLQVFAGLSGVSSGGDRSLGELSLTSEAYGVGSRSGSLESSVEIGTRSSAELDLKLADQPASWFAKPFVAADAQPFSRFDGSHRTDSQTFAASSFGIQAGLLTPKELKLSALVRLGTAGAEVNRNFAQVAESIQFDTMNSELLPTSGLLLQGFLSHLSLSRASSVDQAVATGEWRTSPAGAWTLILNGEGATSFGLHPPVDLRYSPGRSQPIEGYPVDWIHPASYVLGGVALTHRIFKIPFYFGEAQWMAGAQLVSADGTPYWSSYSGLMVATRTGRLLLGAAAAHGFRPHLFFGFGNEPFGRGSPGGLALGNPLQ